MHFQKSSCSLSLIAGVMNKWAVTNSAHSQRYPLGRQLFLHCYSISQKAEACRSLQMLIPLMGMKIRHNSKAQQKGADAFTNNTSNQEFLRLLRLRLHSHCKRCGMHSAYHQNVPLDKSKVFLNHSLSAFFFFGLCPLDEGNRLPTTKDSCQTMGFEKIHDRYNTSP